MIKDLTPEEKDFVLMLMYYQEKQNPDIELLTDTEQRIFLIAMHRERKVCQLVDDTCDYKDSNVSLVEVCDSIIRKVKKIWER